MVLAHGVGMWDTDETSMGEDFHMYLKCFFATQGTLKAYTIYSPASCCNVESDSWFNNIGARVSQAKRHMWAALDIGYILRRAIFGVLAPQYDVKKNRLIQVPIIPSKETGIDILSYASRLLRLIYRAAEAHCIMGQYFALITISTIVIPTSENALYISKTIWFGLTAAKVHPFVLNSLYIGLWIRIIAGIYNVLGLYYYEKYQDWCGTKRWVLSSEEAICPGTGQGVQRLGIRPSMQSTRRCRDLWDWIALPVCGVLFLTGPQCFVQITQIFTNKLDYKVAAKPRMREPEMKSFELEDDISRGDSGFFDIESVNSQSGRTSPGSHKFIDSNLFEHVTVDNFDG
jgi:hypothetical protein